MDSAIVSQEENLWCSEQRSIGQAPVRPRLPPVQSGCRPARSCNITWPSTGSNGGHHAADLYLELYSHSRQCRAVQGAGTVAHIWENKAWQIEFYTGRHWTVTSVTPRNCVTFKQIGPVLSTDQTILERLILELSALQMDLDHPRRCQGLPMVEV